MHIYRTPNKLHCVTIPFVSLLPTVVRQYILLLLQHWTTCCHTFTSKKQNKTKKIAYLRIALTIQSITVYKNAICLPRFRMILLRLCWVNSLERSRVIVLCRCQSPDTCSSDDSENKLDQATNKALLLEWLTFFGIFGNDKLALKTSNENVTSGGKTKTNLRKPKSHAKKINCD